MNSSGSTRGAAGWLGRIGIIAGACVLCSCSATPCVDTYTLLPPAPPAGPLIDTKCAQRVCVPAAITFGVFELPNFVERRGARLVVDTYRRWSPGPAEMLPASLQDSLRRYAGVVADAMPDSHAPLELRSRIIEWSYFATPDTGQPTGWVAHIDCEIVLTACATDTELLRCRFVKDCIAPTAGHEALVAAFASGLHMISSNCAVNVGTVIRGSFPNQSTKATP